MKEIKSEVENEQKRFEDQGVGLSQTVQEIMLAQPLNPLVKLEFHPQERVMERAA